MEKLIVYENETKTEFRIGSEMDGEFDSCSDENICSRTGFDEIELTEIQQKFGATTIYMSYTTDKECTKEEYLKHFEDYDSDISFIVPITTFGNKEKAEECVKQLLTMI
jgi:hypothetical protein